MRIKPKFVELTADVLKIFLKNIRMTAYQFGTVDSCPTGAFSVFFLWESPTFILECFNNVDIR